MAIIKHRPKIRVLMQPEVVAGETASATIVLQAKKPVPCEWVDVELIGEERARVGGSDNSRTQTNNFWHRRYRLRDSGELPEGTTQLQLPFDVPPSCPVSQVGTRGHIVYRIAVHASIPWWPDARRTFDMSVVPVAPNVEGRPVVFTTAADGPDGRRAHMECSLATDVLYPGGAVVGEIALSNTAFNNYRGFTVSVVAMERCKVGRNREERESQRWTVRYDVDAPTEGESFQFRFRLPNKVLVSSKSPTWSVAWKLEAEARIRWASNLSLSIPVTVLPRQYRDRANDRAAPPSVGSERLQELWLGVASEANLSYDEGVMIGAWGEIAVRIQREHRGRKGLHLAAELSYEPFGIGIELAPSLRWNLIHRGLEVSKKMLGRGYEVTGHDEAQIVRLLEAVRGPMKRFADCEIRDSEARVDARGGGATRRGLTQFISSVRALALALRQVRGELPAPVEWVDHVEAWRAVARTLGAELRVPAMSVIGTMRDVRVVIAPVWTPPTDLGSSDPIATAIELVPARAIDKAVGLNLRGQPPEVGRLAAAQAPELARLEHGVLAGACMLQVERDALKVELAPAIVDPSDVIAQVTELVGLASALAATGGPYR